MKKYINYLCLTVCLSALNFACSDNNTDEKLNYEAIDALITECKALLEPAVEGDDINQFVAGSKAIFSQWISEAEHVRNNTDRQSAIDNYIIKLTTAKEVFLESKVMPACPLFNGSDAFIDCGPASQFCSREYTIEVWVKMMEGSGEGVLGCEGHNTVTWDGFLIRHAQNGKKGIDFCVVNNTWSSCETDDGTFLPNQWTHIAATFDSRTSKVYINGVESKSSTISEYITVSHSHLIIGNLAYFNDRWFKGKLYDVRIWNKVKTAQEILDNYQTMPTGNEDGLVANWALNRRTGDTFYDITGQHQAQLYNVTWSDFDNL
jgi:hypothetical protein